MHFVQTHTVARSQLFDTQALLFREGHQEVAFCGETVTLCLGTQERWILKRPKCAHRQLSFVDSQLHICKYIIYMQIYLFLDAVCTHTLN